MALPNDSLPNDSLPNDSPPAYEAYAKQNSAVEKAQPLGDDYPSLESGLPVVDLNPIYRFHGLRWWIVRTVVRWFAWEPSNYARDLYIAIEKDRQDRLLVFGGLLDTGLGITVLCRTTAERMKKAGATIMEHPNGKRAIFMTSNGTPFYSIGKVKARMKVDGSPIYVEREWDVSEKPLDFCEALIGRDLLDDIGRLVLFGAAGSPMVESNPGAASRIEIQQALQARAAARATNPQRVNELRANHHQGGETVPSYGAGTQYEYGGTHQYGPRQI